MKSKKPTLHHLGFIALAFAGLAASSAYADTALTTGHTILDTTGNPALGVISRSTGATALFDNNGVATATGTPLVNGILGPWGFIGTGTTTRYATLDGSNNVVAFTGGTSTTWAGTINSATTHYEISANATATYGGSERVANTIRYTGGAGTVISLGNSSPMGLTTNGLINAGTGTLTFQHGGSALPEAGIHIGATQELVLHAANAPITVNARVHNNTGGASAVTVVGPNTVTLSAASTYTGGTFVNGSLSVSTLANGGSTSSIGASTNVAGNLVLNGTFRYTGAAVSTDRLFSLQTSSTIDASGSGAVNFTNTGSMGFNGGTAAKTLTLTGANTGANTIAAVIGDNTGATGLTKSGAGTWALSGANTYTGATLISGGTLALGAAGSIGNTSGVSLGTVGTFDVTAKGIGGYTVNNLTGSGNVTGGLTVSTQLAIGNSPGTVNFSSDLTLGSASTYLYELTGGSNTSDLGDVAGNLTITAGAILDLVQLGTYTANDKFTLFAYDGILAGTFLALSDDSVFSDAGGVWLINYNDTTAGLNGGVGTRYVTVTAVPEPGAALLGGFGVMALLRRRRKN